MVLRFLDPQVDEFLELSSTPDFNLLNGPTQQ